VRPLWRFSPSVFPSLPPFLPPHLVVIVDADTHDLGLGLSMAVERDLSPVLLHHFRPHHLVPKERGSEGGREGGRQGKRVSTTQQIRRCFFSFSFTSFILPRVMRDIVPSLLGHLLPKHVHGLVELRHCPPTQINRGSQRPALVRRRGQGPRRGRTATTTGGVQGSRGRGAAAAAAAHKEGGGGPEEEHEGEGAKEKATKGLSRSEGHAHAALLFGKEVAWAVGLCGV